MFVDHVSPSRRNAIAVLLMILAVMLGLTASAQYVNAEGSGDLRPEVSPVRMSFHMYQQVYSASNSSILIYSGADTNPPTYATAPTASVSCAIHQSAQIWFAAADFWVGIVSWGTQPLAEEMTIRGNVSMTVWMSTNDSPPTMSGYGFGLTEADSTGNMIGGQFYRYTYGTGSVLSSSPTQYTLVFEVNRTFAKGSLLGFFVAVGSTTQGWHYQVYFDSPSKDSFAELPTLSTPIPEFSPLGILACMTLAMLSFGIIHRRKH